MDPSLFLLAPRQPSIADFSFPPSVHLANSPDFGVDSSRSACFVANTFICLDEIAAVQSNHTIIPTQPYLARFPDAAIVALDFVVPRFVTPHSANYVTFFVVRYVLLVLAFRQRSISSPFQRTEDSQLGGLPNLRVFQSSLSFVPSCWGKLPGQHVVMRKVHGK